MGVASGGQVADRKGAARPGSVAQVPDAAAVAWLLTVPCALVTAAAVWLLGPPLGRLILPLQDPLQFWRHLGFFIQPEPVEQSRFLLSLGGPMLLALTTLVAVRRMPRVPERAIAALVTSAQGVTVGFVVMCVVVQERFRYPPRYGYVEGLFFKHVYFTPRSLAVGVAIALGLVAAVRSERVRDRFTALTAESRSRHVGAVALAVVMTAIWMLHAVNTDASIAWAFSAVTDNLMFTLDETFSVLNGRTPLVDFTAQYGSLWPFLAALPLLAFGKTLLVFTITMTTLTGAALLAIFGVLRRTTRSARTALLLYLPFLATSLFTIRGSYANRLTTGSYVGAFPMRYAGPYLLALLTARRLGQPDARRLWPLFVVAGLSMLNNMDFSLAALGATVAAIVWTSDERPARLAVRLAGGILAGLLGAFALVSLLTLARAGALPQPARLFEYSGKFVRGGFGLIPLPTVVGLDLVIYVTYAAAIATATVRALKREANRVLTGMLVWSGIFGLGTASYYIGRSHPDSLVACFSAWSLSLSLLTIAVFERLRAPRSLRPSIAQFAVLAGLGVTVCSLAMTPTPWSQIDRIETPGAVPAGIPAVPFLPDPSTRNFYASAPYGSRFYIKRGMPVAILTAIGHRVADVFGVVDVSPYTGIWSINTPAELRTTVDALRRAGGNTLLLSAVDLDSQIYELLDSWGFEVLTRDGPQPFASIEREQRVSVPWTIAPVIKWVDMHHLHPRFLREGRGEPVRGY
jgi:hypothetical protein